MLNKNAKLWVEDLRTTQVLQARHALHRINDPSGELDSFCCLGRACVVYNFNNVNNPVAIRSLVTIDGTIMLYEEREGILPPKVREWLGLTDSLGRFDDDFGTNSLANKNDTGFSFKEIADIIESEPKGLFL